MVTLLIGECPASSQKMHNSQNRCIRPTCLKMPHFLHTQYDKNICLTKLGHSIASCQENVKKGGEKALVWAQQYIAGSLQHYAIPFEVCLY